MLKDWITKLVVMLILSFLGLGLAGCAHNSRSSFNVPGVADGFVKIDLELNLPIIGATGTPALTKADVEEIVAAKFKALGDG